MRPGSNNFRVTPNSEQIGIQVSGSSTFGRYDKIGSGLTINMFQSEDWLINSAGWKRVLEYVAGNVGKGRGTFFSVRGNIVISVIDAGVYKTSRINGALVSEQIGLLQTGSGSVFMDENLNNQICIVDGLRAYIYNYATPAGLVVQGSLAGINPSDVTFHNTFFLFGNAGTTNNGALWYAYVYDEADITGNSIKQQTQFTLSTKPDYAVSVRRLPGQANNVIVFGTTVSEIWTQVGGNQNYRRNQSVNIDYGCASVSTIGASGDYVAWLGINEKNSPTIMTYSSSGGLNVISSDGIGHLMDNIKFPEQSTAFFYTQDSHLLYQLTFSNPADNLTLVYDFNTQKFFNLSDAGGDYHPACEMVYFEGDTYFISLNDASLYLSDTNITVYDQNLAPPSSPDYDRALVYDIPRTRICETIRKPDSGRFVANSFVFTMAQGDDSELTQAGIDEGDTYRPRIDMAISKDSGVTWSNYVSRYLHPVGRRKNIITWNKLGTCNELTIKLRWYSRSSIICNNGFVEIY